MKYVVFFVVLFVIGLAFLWKADRIIRKRKR